MFIYLLTACNNYSTWTKVVRTHNCSLLIFTIFLFHTIKGQSKKFRCSVYIPHILTILSSSYNSIKENISINTLFFIYQPVTFCRASMFFFFRQSESQVFLFLFLLIHVLINCNTPIPNKFHHIVWRASWALNFTRKRCLLLWLQEKFLLLLHSGLAWTYFCTQLFEKRKSSKKNIPTESNSLIEKF